MIVTVHQHAFHSKFRGCSRRLPRVIRLRGRTRHQGRGPVRYRVAKSETELPRLVPAERETGQIVPLHEHPYFPAQRLREPGAIVQRRGKFGQGRFRQTIDNSLQLLCTYSHGFLHPECGTGSRGPTPFPAIDA